MAKGRGVLLQRYRDAELADVTTFVAGARPDLAGRPGNAHRDRPAPLARQARPGRPHRPARLPARQPVRAVTTARSVHEMRTRLAIFRRREIGEGIIRRLFVVTLAVFAPLLGGCDEDGVISRFMLKPDRIIVERRPDPVYDQLFPYYVELCAMSQIRFKATERTGGLPGHAVMYIKGACKDEHAPFPQLRRCRVAATDLDDPEHGAGVSVGRWFRNVNWVAIPGYQLFFQGNLKAGERLTEARFEATVRDAIDKGVFDGVEFHEYPAARTGTGPRQFRQESLDRDRLRAAVRAIGFLLAHSRNRADAGRSYRLSERQEPRVRRGEGRLQLEFPGRQLRPYDPERLGRGKHLVAAVGAGGQDPASIQPCRAGKRVRESGEPRRRGGNRRLPAHTSAKIRSETRCTNSPGSPPAMGRC